MINSILVSGEGVTDLGCSRNGLPISQGQDIHVGPMLIVIYKMIYLYSPDWFRDLCDWESDVPITTYLVDRGERARVSKGLKPNLFQTHSNGRGGIEHAKSAWALSEIAVEYGSELVVYFHDTDGTRSQLDRTPNLQRVITEGAMKGFNVRGIVEGVPMVPKPTSEAWFICQVSRPPYTFCHLLEESLSGNQVSPERSPKVVLAGMLNVRLDRDVLVSLAKDLDVERIDMPGFNAFKESMMLACEKIFGAAR